MLQFICECIYCTCLILVCEIPLAWSVMSYFEEITIIKFACPWSRGYNQGTMQDWIQSHRKLLAGPPDGKSLTSHTNQMDEL